MDTSEKEATPSREACVIPDWLLLGQDSTGSGTRTSNTHSTMTMTTIGEGSEHGGDDMQSSGANEDRSTGMSSMMTSIESVEKESDDAKLEESVKRHIEHCRETCQASAFFRKQYDRVFKVSSAFRRQQIDDRNTLFLLLEKVQGKMIQHNGYVAKISEQTRPGRASLTLQRMREALFACSDPSIGKDVVEELFNKMVVFLQGHVPMITRCVKTFKRIPVATRKTTRHVQSQSRLRNRLAQTAASASSSFSSSSSSSTASPASLVQLDSSLATHLDSQRDATPCNSVSSTQTTLPAFEPDFLSLFGS